jgi:hypothetical protein
MEEDAPEEEVQKEVNEETLSEFAKNQVDLAAALGCERKSVQRWLKEKDPECPGKTSDGRYNITLWKLWVEKKGKKPAARLGTDKGALELEKLRLQNEKLRLENEVTKGRLLDQDEVIGVLCSMVREAYEKFRGLKHTLAPQVVGVEVSEATKRLGVEIDNTLRGLSLGEFAKKKVFWQKLYATLGDLHNSFSLGLGENSTS